MAPFLTSRANVLTSLNITGTGDNARIDLLLASVTADVQQYCGRRFFTSLGSSGVFTQYWDGRGGKLLRLPETPILPSPAPQVWVSTAVPRVYDSTTLLTRGTHYILDDETGQLERLGSVWPCGPQAFKATYGGGWGDTSTPADLERAAIEVVAVQLAKGKGQLYHVTSENRGDGTTNFGDDREGVGRFDWPLHAKQVFDRYRFRGAD